MVDQDKKRELMCFQCGMCTGSCPEAGITPFNIRTIVRRRQLQREIEKSIPWLCTSCGACTLRCPRDVKPSEMIINLRSLYVEEGRIPVSIQTALEGTFVEKNPWSRPRSKRGAWMDESDVPIPHISESKTKRLVFTCCIQAYDPRCMVMPLNIGKILNKAGVDFGVLGREEACCGNEIRRMGEYGLFEDLHEENTDAFEKYGVEEIIALSPHCMNALKNEYNDLGIKVSHYTEVLAGLIEQGALSFKGSYNKKVIYHDPCFLGKQNRIYDEPRDILRAVEGIELLEFSEARGNSLCCEGGGGRMFYEAEISYRRNSEKRVQEALDRGADVIATSCPFCLMTLEDPATEKELPVRDISEIIGELL